MAKSHQHAYHVASMPRAERSGARHIAPAFFCQLFFGGVKEKSLGRFAHFSHRTHSLPSLLSLLSLSISLFSRLHSYDFITTNHHSSIWGHFRIKNDQNATLSYFGHNLLGCIAPFEPFCGRK